MVDISGVTSIPPCAADASTEQPRASRPFVRIGGQFAQTWDRCLDLDATVRRGFDALERRQAIRGRGTRQQLHDRRKVLLQPRADQKPEKSLPRLDRAGDHHAGFGVFLQDVDLHPTLDKRSRRV
jgi:hypothetical protein